MCELTEDELKELEELADAATPGPWDSGPETAAGSVWVYHMGSPIFEPLRFIAGILGKLPLFRVRSDTYTYQEWSPSEIDPKQDRFWKQKEADAAFVAASRGAVPKLIAEVRRLRSKYGYNESCRSDSEVKSCKIDRE